MKKQESYEKAYESYGVQAPSGLVLTQNFIL
jgi:hypothetical protein